MFELHVDALHLRLYMQMFQVTVQWMDETPCEAVFAGLLRVTLHPTPLQAAAEVFLQQVSSASRQPDMLQAFKHVVHS
jgi:hypothetical protein